MTEPTGLAPGRTLDLPTVLGLLLAALTRLFTGARARWVGCAPDNTQRIYVANHTSHLDFVLLWSILPARLRRQTRPVAAADYWEAGPLRRYLAGQVFRGVLIRREPGLYKVDPLTPLRDVLDGGESLLLFPEGTRGDGDVVRPFRSGVFHLAASRPQVDVVPVYLDNSYRVMPKGALLPVPLLCSVTFGEPTRLGQEDKEAFLTRLRRSVEALGEAT